MKMSTFNPNLHLFNQENTYGDSIHTNAEDKQAIIINRKQVN